MNKVLLSLVLYLSNVLCTSPDLCHAYWTPEIICSNKINHKWSSVVNFFLRCKNRMISGLNLHIVALILRNDNRFFNWKAGWKNNMQRKDYHKERLIFMFLLIQGSFILSTSCMLDNATIKSYLDNVWTSVTIHFLHFPGYFKGILRWDVLPPFLHWIK